MNVDEGLIYFMLEIEALFPLVHLPLGVFNLLFETLF